MAPELRRLLPHPASTISVRAAYDVERVPHADRPWIGLCMVMSLDGSIAVEGTSGRLGNPNDLDVLLTLARTAAMTLGSLVIPTPGGSGGVEGLYALFLGPPIMPKFLVAPTLLVWRLLGYYIFIALGGYLTMHRVRAEIRARKVAALAVETPTTQNRS